MKQLNTAAAAVLIAAAMLGGCHKSGSNAGKDVTNPTDSAPVNTAQDAAGGVLGGVHRSAVGGIGDILAGVGAGLVASTQHRRGDQNRRSGRVQLFHGSPSCQPSSSAAPEALFPPRSFAKFACCAAGADQIWKGSTLTTNCVCSPGSNRAMPVSRPRHSWP